MPIKAVACKLSTYLSSVSLCQQHFREFGRTFTRHLRDCLRPATWTVPATIGVNNESISAQTIRSHLSSSECVSSSVGPRPGFSRHYKSHSMMSGTLRKFSHPGFHCTGHAFGTDGIVGFQMAILWIEVGVMVMVWGGVCYGPRVHFS